MATGHFDRVSGSINSPVTKFVTLSLEKSKRLLLSLKYSKRVSTAICQFYLLMERICGSGCIHRQQYDPKGILNLMCRAVYHA